MEKRIYGQTPSEEEQSRQKAKDTFWENVAKRAKQIKRKRKLQNKYHLTR